MLDSFNHIDQVIVFIYLLSCIVIGFLKKGTVTNIKQYALGGTGYPIIVLVATIFATNIGAGSTIGAIDKVYSMGIIFVIAQLTEPLLWVISLKIFPKGIERFKGCISLSDIMEKLYSKPGRWVLNISLIFFSIALIGAQVTAIGNIFSYSFDISHVQGVLIGFSVLIAYSTLGGIRAVAFTDLIQFFIFYVAIPLACSNAFNKVGGIDGLLEKLPKSSYEFHFTMENISLLSSMIIYFIMPQISGTFIQRFLMAGTAQNLKKTFYIITLIHIPLVIIICLIGFIMKAINPNIESNFITFYFIQNYLPIGLSGLLIAGLLSVIMSTTDSHLNTMGVLVAHDIAKKLFPKISDKVELNIARIAVVLISAFSILFAIKFKTIINLLWVAANFWDPICMIPIVAGMLGFRTSSGVFIVSVICAITTTTIAAYIQGEFATISMCSGLLGSAIGLFFTHYLRVGFLNTKSLFKKLMPIVYYIADKITVIKLLFINRRKRIFFSYDNNTQVKTEYYLFAIFIVITYSIPIVIGNLREHHYCIEIMYLIAIALCCILCTFSYWPITWQKKYLKLYWWATLLYCLPCISSYILLITNVGNFWLLKFTLSTFLLAILVRWKVFFCLFFIGIIMGLLFYFIFHFNTNIKLQLYETYLIGYLYAFISLIGIVFVRSRDILIAKKVILEQFFGNYVANKMNAPLINIKNIIHDIKKSCDEVYNNTTFIKDKNEYEVSISNHTYKHLFFSLPKKLDFYSKKAKRDTESLLAVLKDPVYRKGQMKRDICSLLDGILDEYGLTEKQKEYLQIKRYSNFYIRASDYGFKQVIFNILQFIFNHISQEDVLIIRLKDDSIYFESNNMLLSDEDVFDNFKFSIFDEDEEMNLGSSLSYCKGFMENLGGSLVLYCSYNEMIKIILKFPSFE